jgi:hypothetical protein
MTPWFERVSTNFLILFVGLLIVTLPIYFIIVLITEYILANIFLYTMIVSFILSQIYFLFFHVPFQMDHTVIGVLFLISITIPIWNIISIIIYYINYFDIRDDINLLLFSYLSPVVVLLFLILLRLILPKRKMSIWDDKIKGYVDID